MGAHRGVSRGGADPLDRSVAQGEVDLAGRPAGGFRGKAGVRKQALRDAVVTTILFENGEPSTRQPALAAKPQDETQLLERPEVGERGRWADAQTRGDVLEAHAPRLALAGTDHPKRLDLAMGELLEGLHGPTHARPLYIGHANY